MTEDVAFFYSDVTVRKLLAVGLMVLGAGCSTTSTISRIHGPVVEADIVGGSPDEIFVSNDAGDFAIPRNDISEIDYPGNVHALIGGITVGVGVFNIMARFDDCEHEHEAKAAVCSAVFLPLAVGAAIMTWGIIVNQGQKSAAADRSRPSVGGEVQLESPYPSWASGHRVAPPPQQPPPPRKRTDAPPPPGASAPAPSAGEPLPPPPLPQPAAGPSSTAPPPPAPAPPAPTTPVPTAPPSKGFPVEN